MAFYDVPNIKVRPIHDHIIVKDMDFGEMKSLGGIIIQSDNAKSHGVKPRWAQIYRVGPDQTEYHEGQWILIEHGRWTRKFKINDGNSEVEIQRVDIDGIIATAEYRPDDFYIGHEIKNGDSINIRPEDFVR